MTTFLNPYTDFGFKKIFGEEASKPLLMDFLNSLLPEHHQIKQLNFRNCKKKQTEQQALMTQPEKPSMTFIAKAPQVKNLL